MLPESIADVEIENGQKGARNVIFPPERNNPAFYSRGNYAIDRPLSKNSSHWQPPARGE
jgi:hypothetical protein